MPHYFQFYEDFVQNEGRLTIEKATRNLAIPHLIIHGNQDTSVSIQEAENLKSWNPNAVFEVIEGADHVFNVKQPWTEDQLSTEMQFMVDRSIAFLKE
jgi:pimeloyl-ACP methyl ester carboxylesterase